MPSACFAEELIEAFPEAKVVLVQREESAWLRSFRTAIIDTYFESAFIVSILSIFDGKLARPIYFLWKRLLASEDGLLGGTTQEQTRNNALSVYRKHNALVEAQTAPGNLLHFNLKDGWEPLCAFLGTEVPSVPFPNVNEGDAVKEVVATFIKNSIVRASRNFLAILGVTGAAAYYLLV
ncbi:hypothetical protein N7492_007930 [Penicillium capsulatum]|uniref:Uncharacterized protein n=1 Tax=Penicillium capsulatum TaxID=69766 RepID=A0A9W9I319_9EURO|nr:hypothetical protein N7492_007930 [Penicillium capsulatum]KAJ6117759.1 hypothetical protein N7512_007484 [Penicillium capsulatum]